ncbi:GMC oxidoreductase [Sphaerobolus stellatus SS14]|uniref:Unplaced genomic scaffold SPHSTscaffold_170, whole genome shotgun sequence n=1 Tax=Sphaerobolus stellatus (strain SS14) TaxID=990650 RepID=A0A0C9V1E6_SPHS4|nr:GMC oxidoreductase [Sphaerobolus stellatus SS14]
MHLSEFAQVRHPPPTYADIRVRDSISRKLACKHSELLTILMKNWAQLEHPLSNNNGVSEIPGKLYPSGRRLPASSMVRQLLTSLSLALVCPCYAALYERAASLSGLRYDFVIVGAGTAGNVIANRLTEDPGTSVLVLEAGISNECQLASEIPFIGVSALTVPNPINWNFTTVAEVGLNNRTRDYPRGFMLGGSSSINGMNEIFTEPTDHHNTAGQFNPAVHGFNGVNSVSLPGFAFPYTPLIIKATQQLPNDFPFNLDMNSGKPLGIGFAQETTKNGVRSSSATSYLAPKYINRPNLHVLINARVTKVVKTSSGKQPLAFQQVEFTQDGFIGKRIQIQAKKEVILSAGAPLLHLPSVGKNALDHPVTGLGWTVNSTDTLDEINRNITLFNEAFALWNETHGGLFGTNGQGHIGWKRIPKTSPIFQKFPDLSAGPNSAHIELLLSNSGASGGSTGSGFSVAVIIVSPASRGTIGLSSNNPFQQPVINTGALTSDFDVLALKEGFKMAKQFVTAPVFKDYIINLATPAAADNATDAEVEAYIRNTVITAYHITGTAAMTAQNADYGVVNPDLTVKGVKGLRIVDASIFPFIPSGHTQAPTYIIAERAADLIKAAWK